LQESLLKYLARPLHTRIEWSMDHHLILPSIVDRCFRFV
jgi:hypothetical protein